LFLFIAFPEKGKNYLQYSKRNKMPQNIIQGEVNEKAKAALIDESGKPTSHFQAYIKYQENWKNKRKAYDSAYANASNNPLQLQQWPIEGVLYQQETDEAWDRWVALGFKNEIENAINILASQPTDPAIKSLIEKVGLGGN